MKVKCRYCGSENIKLNRQKTEFCLECNICVSRKGIKPQRMPGHPFYEKLGYRIQPIHPDYTKYFERSKP
jgi:hypothetical protein